MQWMFSIFGKGPALLIALFVFAAIGVTVKPAAAQLADDPKAWSDSVLDALIHKGEDEAKRLFKEESYLGQLEPSAMEYFGEQLKTARQAAGTLINYEFVNKKVLGTKLAQLFYTLHYTQLPAILILRFYKPPGGWNLIWVSFQIDPEVFQFE